MTMSEKKSIFDVLNAINVNDKTEKKGDLTYLSWAWAWGEVKKAFPDATFTIYERQTEYGPVNYFTDGRTCWVKTGLTINGLEHIEELPVMNFSNKSIFLENVTSTDVNKTIQRSLTKAAARHGLGLYIYAGEDLPEEEKQQNPPKDEKKEEKPAAKPASKPAPKPAANPENKTPAPIVDISSKVPEIPKEKAPKAEKTPVQQFLITAMKGLREAREITPAQNNKLFNEQWKALIERKLAPDKALEEYTMPEAESLIDAMWKCFSPEENKFIEGAK